MASGGKRPGAGRKKGSANKTTKARREAAQRIAEAETTPLDVLSAGMLYHFEQWKAGKADDDLVAACEFAAKAAPYVHPRLASTDTTLTHDVTDPLMELLKQIDGRTQSLGEAGEPGVASKQSVRHNGQGRA